MGTEATEEIRARYNRISRVYDLMEAAMEKAAFSRWRRRVLDTVSGNRILEVGVGTGKNMGLYPVDRSITAIDFSPGMLDRAREKATRIGVKADLLDMDVEDLQFPDHAFDTVLATFVFCSVPNPIKGLLEIRRVCKERGKIILLEHVRPGNRILGKLFDILNRLTLRMMGVNINRDTVANMKRAGLKVVSEENLFLDIVKFIIAKP